MISISEAVSIITAIVTIASIITALTPTPKDDIWFGRIYKIVETLGLVVGKAKDK